MADRMLFIGWGRRCAGWKSGDSRCSTRPSGCLAACSRRRIESFDVALYPERRAERLRGVHGTRAQIDALREDDEFLRNTATRR